MGNTRSGETIPDALIDEAVAVIAAINAFMRNNFRRATASEDRHSSTWKHAAIAEGVVRQPTSALERVLDH